MLIQVNQLGLAAYILMHGSKLLHVKERVFHFESDKTVNQWRELYMNSESMRHDSLVCDLRDFLRAPLS